MAAKNPSDVKIEEEEITKKGGGPVNPKATAATRNMFDNLMKIQKEDRVLFGQYNGTYQGRAADNVGDIYDMTGQKPGINEWHVPYFYAHQRDEKMKRLHEDYESGMLIGFFWRMDNPITGTNANDHSDGQGGNIDIDTLLPGRKYHHKYLEMLDMFVEIAHELPKIDGEPIPVFLRFLPEMSRGYSRWYKTRWCTPSQYKDLWKVAQNYLQKEKGLNNILWHFNPNETADTSSNKFGYKEFYPGHDMVDICGRNTASDDYAMGPHSMDTMRHAIEVASEAGKLVAISQQNSYCSNNNGGESIPNWWTEVWLSRLVEDDLMNKMAYVCAWKNTTDDSYFVPYKGHEHEYDFMLMSTKPGIMMSFDLKPLSLYLPPSSQPDSKEATS